MLRERLLKAFKEIGFDEYKEIQPCDVVFSKDVSINVPRILDIL